MDADSRPVVYLVGIILGHCFLRFRRIRSGFPTRNTFAGKIVPDDRAGATTVPSLIVTLGKIWAPKPIWQNRPMRTAPPVVALGATCAQVTDFDIVFDDSRRIDDRPSSNTRIGIHNGLGQNNRSASDRRG